MQSNEPVKQGCMVAAIPAVLGGVGVGILYSGSTEIGRDFDESKVEQLSFGSLRGTLPRQSSGGLFVDLDRNPHLRTKHSRQKWRFWSG